MLFLIGIFFMLAFFVPAPVFATDGITINEVLVHPLSGGTEWVEIYNPDQRDLSTYWIDDDIDFSQDSGGSAKKQLDGFQLGMYSIFELPSAMFNNAGDKIVLFDEQGTIVDQYEYTNDPGVDVSLGRSPDRTGEFSVLASATKGSANSEIVPTVTLTPTKAPTATKAPSPTKIPTPTKSGATPTKVATPTKSIPIPTKVIPTKAGKNLADNIASNDAYPTVVLAISLSPSISPKKIAEQKVLVKDIQKKSSLIAASFITSGILFVACGILIYRRTKHETDSNND